MKYQIGQQVWRATFDVKETRVTCPDCLGSSRLRVIMGDETVVSIACENCKSGWNGPRGYLVVHDRGFKVTLVRITGAQISDGEPEYHGDGFWGVKECDLFDNESDAEVAAKRMCDEKDAEERDAIKNKVKDHRSWAWNANYHRQCIRSAQKEIERHTACLNFAVPKSREEKAKAP